MNKFLTIATSTTLLIGAFLITGCSSSDDGGGSGTATVPANAIVLDSTNAESTIATLVSSLDTFGSTLDSVITVETIPVMGLNAALEIIEPLIKNRLKNSGIDLTTGVAFSEGGACTGSGTFSITGDSTDDGTTFSDTFTATFNNCIESSLTINGTVSGTFTENISTGAYADNVSGSLTITVVTSTDTVSISFNGLSFQETGNNLNFTYTTTQATYAIDFVINGTQGGGFLVSLTAPIVESNGDNCPESGHITITGANGTTAEGIYNGDGTMTIKANGEIVTTTAVCYV